MNTEYHLYHRELEAHIQRLLPSAHLKLSPLPFDNTACCELKLWLIDPVGMDAPLSEEEVSAIFSDPPYWSAC